MVQKSNEIGKIIVGIDPDIKASGVALLDEDARIIKLYKMPIYSLFNWCRWIAETTHDKQVRYIVELDRQTTYNWHVNPRDNCRVAKQKGFWQGSNHQLAIDIVDLLRESDLDVTEQAPLRKCWTGKDRKITHQELRSIEGITWNKAVENQEERDAALLALAHSKIVIKFSRR